MKLSRQLAALLFSLLTTSCATMMQTSDFEAMVILPASGDCFGLHVMSGIEKRYPAEVCKEIVKRAVFLTSANWKMLREDVQKNCQYQQCQQITGAFDGLFLSIDKALQKIP
jgi:hypothetical protein